MFEVLLCTSHRGQSALSDVYRVGLSRTVELKFSRIMAKLSLPQRTSWTFRDKSRRSNGSVTVRSIAK